MKAMNKATVDKAVENTKKAGRQVMEQASSAAESGKEQVLELAETSKHQVVGFLEEKKEDATAAVRELDHVLRETAQEVENPNLGHQIERLADGLQSVAQTLESTKYDDVLHSLERLAREKPTVFLAGGFALGVGIARFLRASSSRGVHHPSELPSAGIRQLSLSEQRLAAKPL